MHKNFSFKLVWAALKDSFKGFSDDKVTKLSASLAYYTIFSLGPLLFLVIHLASVFFHKDAVQGKVVEQLQAFVGRGAADQIQTIMQNASVSGSGLASIIGIAVLLVGATTVFAEMQDSMNSIWGVKAQPKSGIVKLLMSRLLSFGIIASLVFLLLVSLTVSTLVESLGARLERAFPDVAIVVIYIVNMLLTLTVISLLFAVIFKILPDVDLSWQNAWPGAIATAILFMIGKFAISFYLSKSDVGSTYGAAGSLVILILWIYYSSIILYFGAEFTQSYACERGTSITPSEHADWNESATIAGSKAKKKIKDWKEQDEQKAADKQIVLPVQTVHFSQPRLAQNQKPGIGTAVLGLVLYFVTKSSKKSH